MSDERDLPNSWAMAKVGEVCVKLQYGYTASATNEPCGPRLLRITDIQNGQVQWPSVPYCLIDSSELQKFTLQEGDIVFARTGGTVGKSFIISTIPEDSVFASYLIRLTAHPDVNPQFLYYFFQSLSYWEQIGLKKGGLQGNVNATTLASLDLPICPTNEQARIVAKIEELFSELDKGVESLTTARDQLRAYRQSVLKHAFEGKLTEDWRPDKSSWQTLPVAELLCAPLCNGRSVKDRAGGFPVLRLTALKHGRIDLIESKEGAWDRTTPQPLIVVKGDFFVARGNGSKSLVGIGGLVGEVGCDVAFPDTMIRLRLNTSKVDSRYFALCWNSRVLRQQIEREARTTAGIYKINQDHISAFTLPVPPLDEQKIIVSRLEKRLSETDFAHQQIESEIRRADALRQSILKQAFSGQLVPQDASDEPASVLLERIRVEQEAGSPKKRRNNKNGKKEAA